MPSRSLLIYAISVNWLSVRRPMHPCTNIAMLATRNDDLMPKRTLPDVERAQKSSENDFVTKVWK